MIRNLLAVLALLLSVETVQAGYCTGRDNGTVCTLVDGSTGACALGFCEPQFNTVPGGETLTGTGTIDVAADGTITGTGTAFDTELHIGDLVQCSTDPTWWVVLNIGSATSANALSTCVVLGFPCPTCTAANFVFLRPIQQFLDQQGKIVGVIDGLGRLGIGPTTIPSGGSFALGSVLTYLPPDPPAVSSGDGSDAGVSILLGAAAGAGTSAANKHGGQGEALGQNTGAGGPTSGGGTSKGGKGGPWGESMGPGGSNTGAGTSAAGGDGGDRIFTGSAGGDSANGNGGNAGSWIVNMGKGGEALAPTTTSGNGGSIEFTAGDVGNGGTGLNGHIYMVAPGEHRLTGSPLKLNGAGWPADAPGVLSNDGAGILDWVAVPRLLPKIDLTGQTANITDTTITGTAGTYSLAVYVVDTTVDLTAGAVTVNIKFNDGSAAQTVTVGPALLTTLGAMAQATVVADLASGNLTYGSTHTGIFGSAVYRVKIIPTLLTP